MFLICGDHAWPGIPSYAKGGPCNTDGLSLLMPNTAVIITHKLRKVKHQRRATHAFNSDFKGDTEFWSPSEIITASVLTPRVATAQALSTLN